MKPATKMSDDEILQEIVDQVRASRNPPGHNRKRTRELAAEADKRGLLKHAKERSEP